MINLIIFLTLISGFPYFYFYVTPPLGLLYGLVLFLMFPLFHEWWEYEIKYEWMWLTNKLRSSVTRAKKNE